LRGLKYFLIFLLSIFVHSSPALRPVLFGPEFTFMHDPNFPKRDLFIQLEDHLVRDQPAKGKFRMDRAYKDRKRFISPNGWWTAVSLDSGGYEVNVKAMTVADYKKYAVDLQDAIFASAANVGHFPALWQGGGHINIDLENFRRNPLLFRNFIVDLLNHGELYMGIFNYDSQNAPPYQQKFGSIRDYLSQRGQSRDGGFDAFFRSYLASADLEFPNLTGTADFNGLLRKLNSNFFGDYTAAFSLRKPENRLELRAVRPQASIDVFIRQIELIEARLRYLETFKTRIAYNPQVTLKDNNSYADSLKYKLTPPVEPQEAMRAFYNYVTESGQLWRNHRDYMWPQWISGGELEKFELSEWFDSRENGRESACAKLLDDGVGVAGF
jgi:hypothetical protein